MGARAVNHLFVFGMGYCARALARQLDPKHWRITGTSRTDEVCQEIESAGYDALVFDGKEPVDIPPDITHLLISIPPDEHGDPVLRHHAGALGALAKQIKWAGYLSTTGVYGNRDGGWVDENSELLPSTERGQRRVTAEMAWLEIFARHGLPVTIFRLAGIYGPGRNQLVSLRAGKSRRVVKQGQVFSRIHVDDIATVLAASMANVHPGAAYNVCDDDPASPQEVVAYAAELLGMEPPPEVAFEDAEMSDMGRSFYAESKRVANRRIKQELGVALAYTGYRDGLKTLTDAGEGNK
jgi:nucleoside-diphosphate-sugar epimerase